MRPEIPGPLKTTYERILALQKQLAGLRKRETQEKLNLENIHSRIAKLEKLATESLSGSDKDFAKYKTSIKKLNEQADVTAEMLEKIKSVKKSPENELHTHRHNLPIHLNNYIIECRKLADKELLPKLDSLMTDIENFINDCRNIYQDHGRIFNEPEYLIPLGLPIDFLNDYRKKKALRDAAKKPEIVSQPEVESTQTAPVEVQAPSPEPDGTSIPPELLSQAVEAESAVNDVVGEVPEPVTEAAALMDKKTIGTVKLQPSGSEMPSEGIEVPPELLSQPEATPEASNEPSETFLENSDLTCEDENNG